MFTVNMFLFHEYLITYTNNLHVAYCSLLKTVFIFISVLRPYLVSDTHGGMERGVL